MKKLSIYKAILPAAMIMLQAVCPQARAVTAYPYPVDYAQPDHTVVKIRMMGDEKIKWAETMDQYTLLRNREGAWEYARQTENGDIVPSGFLAHNPGERGFAEENFLLNTEKKLAYSPYQTEIMLSVWRQRSTKSSTGLNPSGNKKLIMILMDYPDLPFTKTTTDFDDLMNQMGYNTGTAVGSVKDYYLENSYQQFNLTTTVVGPFTASQNMAYYGVNDPNTGYDLRPDSLVCEAVRLANPVVNYAEFDNDNDGILDGLYVIYAGYGEEAGASANAIWAHAWSIVPVIMDGITISDYSCSAELRGNAGNALTSIGIICHEFGHLCGAPDFYDTDYSTNGQFDGTGYWDMMASGSWNNNGDMPAHHNPYTKSAIYGWLTPTVVSTASDLILRDIKEYPDVLRINTTTANEYFLYENRQHTGFNATCPGHGLIIYHVDGTHIANNFATNTININGHQGLFPMAANSLSSNGVNASSNSTINTDACPYPGTTTKRIFDDYSWPHSKSWVNALTGVPVNNIYENGGAITLCVFNCDGAKPTGFSATATGQNQINLSWTANFLNDPVMVAVNSVNDFGNPVNGTVYNPGQTLTGGGTILFRGIGTFFPHMNLAAGTIYYYKAWSVSTGNVYSAGVLSNGTTQCGIYYPSYSQDFAGTAMPVCWSVADNAGNGCNWQFGTITDVQYPGFSPALTGNYAYINSDACGNVLTNADLISPVFDFSDYVNVRLEFRFYYRQWKFSTATLYYSLNNGATWNTIMSTSTTSTNPSIFNLILSYLDGQPSVIFKWNFFGTWEYYWAVDDIKVNGTYAYTWTGAVDNDWHTAGNWAGNAVPVASKDVVIPNVPNLPIITQATTLPATCNDLTIEPGASLSISPGNFLSVIGMLDNQAGVSGLIVQSDPTGTGSIIHYSTGTDVTFDRYLTNADWSDKLDGWHYLSSPVGAHPISPNFTTAPYDFYCWYEPGDVWVNYKNTSTEPTWNTANGSGNFNTGQGYLVAYDNGGTHSFTGQLNVTDIPFSNLSITDPQANWSWHLLGNPFGASLQWDAAIEWNLSGIGGVAKIWNEAGQSLSDITSNPSGDIPQTNGFLVQVSSPANSITLPAVKRNHSPVNFYKNSMPALLLKATNVQSGNFQENRLIVYPSSTTGFDLMYDGIFLKGHAPALYSIIDNYKLSTQSIPSIDETTEIPLGFIPNSPGNAFRIEATGVESLPATVFLCDLKTGVVTNLSKNPVYYFSTASGDPTGRFRLKFGATGMMNPAQPYVYTADKILFLKNLQSAADVEIYGTDGRQMVVIKNAGDRIPLHLAAGVYIIQLKTNNATRHFKVFIH
jgi:M6 family metalloprotease-like protein